MRFILQLLGFGLILLGIYFLGQNIFFTTNVYPYYWRGIAADTSILFLTFGIFAIFAFPKDLKNLGWGFIGIAIVLIFASSRAILNPTSLWQFFLSIISMNAGYQLLTKRKLNF
jgi:hypothetical protein